jgi:DNA-binding LacI/PurR family transcriptional regulator
MYETTLWLIGERNHRCVGFIGVPSTKAGERRWNGFVRAMEEAKLSIQADYVKSGDFSVDSGERAMRELLQLPQPPTVVFACNDLMALGCLMAAQAMGFRVPYDVAVVGFDNVPEAARVKPRLTTVAQYPSEMGERLAVALFERINGIETGPGRPFEVPCRLIVRESA